MNPQLVHRETQTDPACLTAEGERLVEKLTNEHHEDPAYYRYSRDELREQVEAYVLNGGEQ